MEGALLGRGVVMVLLEQTGTGLIFPPAKRKSESNQFYSLNKGDFLKIKTKEL